MTVAELLDYLPKLVPDPENTVLMAYNPVKGEYGEIMGLVGIPPSIRKVRDRPELHVITD